MRNCAAWTRKSTLCIISAISQAAKDIWKEAVAYLQSAQVPFAALVRTSEVGILSFEGVQVITMDRKIDNTSENTYSWLCYLLYLPNDHLFAKNLQNSPNMIISMIVR